MVKKITDEQKEKAWRLYNHGESIANIAEYVSVSCISAWVMTKGRKRGFKTINEYNKHLAKQRSKRRDNIELKDLIHSYLKKFKKNQSWLAEKIGVSRQAVSFYALGKSIPKYETLDKLFNILEIKKRPRSLCDLVKEM